MGWHRFSFFVVAIIDKRRAGKLMILKHVIFTSQQLHDCLWVCLVITRPNKWTHICNLASPLSSPTWYSRHSTRISFHQPLLCKIPPMTLGDGRLHDWWFVISVKLFSEKFTYYIVCQLILKGRSPCLITIQLPWWCATASWVRAGWPGGDKQWPRQLNSSFTSSRIANKYLATKWLRVKDNRNKKVHLCHGRSRITWEIIKP